MNRTNDFGSELRRRRTTRGVSLRELATGVHCDPGYLSRVERGLRQPSTMVARLCDQAVSADGALLALLRTPTPKQASVNPDIPAPRPVSFLVRSFERAAGGATVLTDDHESTAVGAGALFGALRAQGHASPPSALLPALAVQFGVLSAASAKVTGESRERLYLLAARYAEYAGWMVQECGDQLGALALIDVAAGLAELANDGPLMSYLVIRRADVALDRGDGATVVTLAETVERGAAPVRVRALAAQRAAQGWALLGRVPECLSALARAEDLMAAADAAEADTTTGIMLGSGGGGRLMDIVRGWCYLDLGLPGQAVDALQSGLDQAPPTAHRARALYGVRLALAHATIHDMASALATGTAALTEARDVESASVRLQLQALATMMRRRSGGEGIHGFRTLIDAELKPSQIRS